MGPTWEYVVDTINTFGFFASGEINSQELTDRLNWYGGQGWEMVSSYTTTAYNGGAQMLVFVYKRPRPGSLVTLPPLNGPAAGCMTL